MAGPLISLHEPNRTNNGHAAELISVGGYLPCDRRGDDRLRTSILRNRTTLNVERSLSLSADLKDFFAGHDLKQLEATVGALIPTIKRRANNGETIA